MWGQEDWSASHVEPNLGLILKHRFFFFQATSCAQLLEAQWLSTRRRPAEELTQLSSGKPGSDLDRVATFTMQQRVLSSGSADRESQGPALGLVLSHWNGFCNWSEAEFS